MRQFDDAVSIAVVSAYDELSNGIIMFMCIFGAVRSSFGSLAIRRNRTGSFKEVVRDGLFEGSNIKYLF